MLGERQGAEDRRERCEQGEDTQQHLCDEELEGVHLSALEAGREGWPDERVVQRWALLRRVPSGHREPAPCPACSNFP